VDVIDVNTADQTRSLKLNLPNSFSFALNGRFITLLIVSLMFGIHYHVILLALQQSQLSNAGCKSMIFLHTQLRSLFRVQFYASHFFIILLCYFMYNLKCFNNVCIMCCGSVSVHLGPSALLNLIWFPELPLISLGPPTVNFFSPTYTSKSIKALNCSRDYQNISWKFIQDIFDSQTK